MAATKITIGGGSGIEKTRSIKNPTAAERMPFGLKTSAVWTLTEVSDYAAGTSPSVTYNIGYSSTRTGAVTNVFASGRVVTAGSDVTTFASATIPAGSFVWLMTSAVSGTVDMFSVTIKHTTSTAPTQLFLDNFTGPNGRDITAHAADIGGTWTGAAGVFTLNGAGQAAAVVGDWVYNTPTGQHTQMVVKIMNHGLGQGANFLFRTRNANADFLLAAVTRHATAGNPGEIIIYQSIGGTSTQIASVAHTGHSGEYTLTMSLTGGTFSATITGVGATATASATTTFTAASTDRIGINFAAGIQADQITAE